MERRTITVTGMGCPGCEASVESALRSVPGVQRVAADHETDSVEIVIGDVEDATLRVTIREAGYELAT